MEWSLSQDNYYDTSVKKCNVIDFSFTSPSFPVQWSVRVPVYVNIGICSYLINKLDTEKPYKNSKAHKLYKTPPKKRNWLYQKCLQKTMIVHSKS